MHALLCRLGNVEKRQEDDLVGKVEAASLVAASVLLALLLLLQLSMCVHCGASEAGDKVDRTTKVRKRKDQTTHTTTKMLFLFARSLSSSVNCLETPSSGGVIFPLSAFPLCPSNRPTQLSKLSFTHNRMELQNGAVR